MTLSLRVWRAINIAILAVAVLAPWEVLVAYDVGTDPPIYQISGWDATFDLVGFRLQDMMTGDFGMGFSELLLFTIGSLSLIVYIISSTIWLVKLIIGQPGKMGRGVLWIAIVVSSLLLLMVYRNLPYDGFVWGYWLGCVGWLSSLVLETVEVIFLKRQAKRSNLCAA